MIRAANFVKMKILREIISPLVAVLLAFVVGEEVDDTVQRLVGAVRVQGR